MTKPERRTKTKAPVLLLIGYLDVIILGGAALIAHFVGSQYSVQEDLAAACPKSSYSRELGEDGSIGVAGGCDKIRDNGVASNSPIPWPYGATTAPKLTSTLEQFSKTHGTQVHPVNSLHFAIENEDPVSPRSDQRRYLREETGEPGSLSQD